MGMSSLAMRLPNRALRSNSGMAVSQLPAVTFGGVSSTRSRSTSAITSRRSPYRASRAASRAENFATSRSVLPAPILRYWVASSGRKFAKPRSTTRKPCRGSSRSRMTFGLSSDTV